MVSAASSNDPFYRHGLCRDIVPGWLASLKRRRLKSRPAAAYIVGAYRAAYAKDRAICDTRRNVFDGC
jgi:hypothetical protein